MNVAAALSDASHALARRSPAGARFLRFLVVGSVNTAVGYGLFYLALIVLPTTFAALCASTVVAILFSFATMGRLVFGSRDPRRIGRFLAVYAVIFIYNAAGLAVLESVGVTPQLGGLLLLPIAVGLSYLLNRRFVFAPAR